jgi:hypothetical protein
LPLLVALGAPALGGDSAAEQALNGKGLTKVGRVFVDVEAEKPVLARIKEVRASTFAAFASAAEKQAAAEQLQVQSALLAEQHAELQANLSALNQQVNAQNASMGGRYGRMARMMGPSPLQVQQREVSSAVNQAAAMQKSVKAQIPSAQAKQALDADVKKKGDAFKSDLTDLRKLVDEVTKKYADLAADPKVKKAIDDMEKAGHAKISLGPSEAFHAGMKDLDQAERRFLGKKPAAPAHKSKAKAKEKAKN